MHVVKGRPCGAANNWHPAQLTTCHCYVPGHACQVHCNASDLRCVALTTNLSREYLELRMSFDGAPGMNRQVMTQYLCELEPASHLPLHLQISKETGMGCSTTGSIPGHHCRRLLLPTFPETWSSCCCCVVQYCCLLLTLLLLLQLC